MVGRPLPDALARLATARRQRPVVIGEPRLVPARLQVPEEPEALHQPGLQPRTSATWPGVSGDGRAPGMSRRSSAIRAIASPSSSPWRTSQQPTTVPVRPTPPQQWTYTVPPSAAHGVDVVENLHHVAGRRCAHVGDRVGDPPGAAEKVLVALEGIRWVGEVDEQRDAVRRAPRRPRAFRVSACDHALADRVVSGHRHHREPTPDRRRFLGRLLHGLPGRSGREAAAREIRDRAPAIRVARNRPASERLAGERRLVVTLVVRIGEGGLGESAANPRDRSFCSARLRP